METKKTTSPVITDKDILIIRQSQMERAIEYYQTIKKLPSTKDIIKTASMFEYFIKYGYSDSLMKKLDALDEHIEQRIPSFPVNLPL
jgi:hypothetical protein